MPILQATLTVSPPLVDVVLHALVTVLGSNVSLGSQEELNVRRLGGEDRRQLVVGHDGESREVVTWRSVLRGWNRGYRVSAIQVNLNGTTTLCPHTHYGPNLARQVSPLCAHPANLSTLERPTD